MSESTITPDPDAPTTEEQIGDRGFGGAPRSGPPPGAIAAVAVGVVVLVALGVHLYDKNKKDDPDAIIHDAEEYTTGVVTIAERPEEPSPPDLASTNAKLANAPTTPIAPQAENAFAVSTNRQASERSKVDASPVLIYDAGRIPPADVRGRAEASQDAQGETPTRFAADRTIVSGSERFQSRDGVITRVALATTLLEGSRIAATLETAIDSDLSGPIRAVTTRDVLAADFGAVLIPRGSRMIGNYKSGVARGQARLFVIWERIIRPDGIAIRLAAPGSDGAGRAGLKGARDSHFLERFGASVILSMIDAGLQAGVADAGRDKSGDAIVLNTGDDFARAAEIALEADIDIAPTIRIAAGQRVIAAVTQDIDFAGLAQESGP